MVVAHLLLSYNYFGGWWNSAAGTMVIILLSYLVWEKHFPDRTGLRISAYDLLKTLALSVLLTTAAFLIMNFIARSQNISIQFTDWRNYFHDVFYVLNEEIILGAIPLMLMVRKWKMNPVVASLSLALLFSIIHFIFYRWVFLDSGIIRLTTLLTLFFIGVVRNNLILYTGHVGYSWALHFSWMAVMFGSSHEYLYGHSRLSEPERFNIYLGSFEMMVLSTLLFVISLIFLVRKGNARLIIME